MQMARTDPQHNHRFDSVALKEMLWAAAQANGRSLTAEINARLKQSFESGNEGSITVNRTCLAGGRRRVVSKWGNQARGDDDAEITKGRACT